jgi:hypothetical protein
MAAHGVDHSVAGVARPQRLEHEAAGTRGDGGVECGRAIARIQRDDVDTRCPCGRYVSDERPRCLLVQVEIAAADGTDRPAIRPCS